MRIEHADRCASREEEEEQEEALSIAQPRWVL